MTNLNFQTLNKDDHKDHICPCRTLEPKETQLLFPECCLPKLLGEVLPKNGEETMRSRYSAFVTGQIQYLIDSHHPDTRKELNVDELGQWSKEAEWESLKILKTTSLSKDEEEVEFICRYSLNSKVQNHHELSTFKKDKSQKWFFYDGKLINDTVVRSAPKIGRNDPCSCGSGKKFKKCCGI